MSRDMLSRILRETGAHRKDEGDRKVDQSPSTAAGQTHSFALLGNYEYAFLSLESELDYLAFAIGNHAGILRLAIALFPTPVRFGHQFFAIQDRQVIAVDHKPVVARLDVRLPHSYIVSNRNSGGHGLSECRDCYRQSACQYEIREERLLFHVSLIPFHYRVNRKRVAWREELTHR